MNVIVANANGADDTWLGMTGITDGVLPSVWPFDKTPVDYIYWDKERLLESRTSIVSFRFIYWKDDRGTLNSG